MDWVNRLKMANSARKVLFIHDTCLVDDGDGRFYSQGQITDATLARFDVIGDEIVVVSRLKLTRFVAGLVEITDPKVRISPVRGYTFLSVFTKHLGFNVVRIWQEVRSADVVVLRLPCILSFLAAPVLWIRSMNYSVELVAFPLESLRGKGDGIFVRVLAKILHAVTAMLVTRAVGVLYVTQSALQAVYPTNGLTGVASNVVLGWAPILVNRRSLVTRETPVQIGLVGTFSTTYKGIDIAIEAISKLSRLGYQCELRVLGSGDKKSLKQLAEQLGCSDSVIFDGIRESGAELAAWLDKLDIYIQPSRTEGLPRALVEAMARGLPAVASKVGGIPELLDDHWLTASGESDPLADKIAILIEDECLRNVAREENVRRAVKYSAEILQKRRVEFYKKVARILGDGKFKLPR